MIIDEDFENESQATAEELKEYVHSSEFKDSLEKASKKKIEILNEFKPGMRDAKEDFIEYMLNACGHLEKDEYKSKKKEFGKAFNKLVKFQHYTGGYPKPTSEGKIKKLVDDFEIALKYFDFIKNPILKNELNSRGIFIEDSSDTLITDYPNIKEDSWENLKSIIDDADGFQTNICVNSDAVKDDIFMEEVPEDLQYSKSNKCGLKASQFNKLALIKAMKTQKSDEAMEQYVNNITENSIFNVAREELLQEGIEEAK